MDGNPKPAIRTAAMTLAQLTRRAAATLAAVGLLLAAPAYAGKKMLTVNAQDSIYNAGQTTKQPVGKLPHSVVLPAGISCVAVLSVKGSLACDSPLGCITLNPNFGQPFLNDPDGNLGQVSESDNTGTATISGIEAPGAGYLVALFTAAGGPTGAAPPALDFTQRGGTAFATLSPMLDQTFFVGDGRRGDNSGGYQFFTTPAGADRLYFGISDACDYHGAPGCYYDNGGTYQVEINIYKHPCQ
jgi:hypothetical protein